MNIIFFGNTKYSKIVEASLYHKLGLSALVTLPDQPVGRKKIITSTPTKAFALEHKIAVFETLKLDEVIIAKITDLQPDFLVVADYRLFLPKSLLNIPKYAALNMHHSLLPKYRGSSPAQAAILAGEKNTGVTIILMEEALDAGKILNQSTYSLQTNETTDSLLITLNTLGAESLVKVIEGFSNYLSNSYAQDETQATYTPRINRQDGFIDLQSPPTPEIFDRMVRAYFPWPNVWSMVRIKNENSRIKFLPNRHLQLEGKNPVSLETFYRGYPELRDIIGELYN